MQTPSINAVRGVVLAEFTCHSLLCSYLSGRLDRSREPGSPGTWELLPIYLITPSGTVAPTWCLVEQRQEQPNPRRAGSLTLHPPTWPGPGPLVNSRISLVSSRPSRLWFTLLCFQSFLSRPWGAFFFLLFLTLLIPLVPVTASFVAGVLQRPFASPRPRHCDLASFLPEILRNFSLPVAILFYPTAGLRFQVACVLFRRSTPPIAFSQEPRKDELLRGNAAQT